MRSVITVHPDYEAHLSWTADTFRGLWEAQGSVEFIRQQPGDKTTLGELIHQPATVTRLASFGIAAGPGCIDALAGLNEAVIENATPEVLAKLTERGVRVYRQLSEGFWGSSVSEFGLALTLCALRRIPQTHHEIMTSLQPWDYNPPGGIGRPGARAHQYGDDSRFTSGTLEGKRVRVVGAGNIASRYASFAKALGADVAAWDPFASEPCFHRAGSRREFHLDRLVEDAEIFVPMVPLTDKTEGLITAKHINALPKGCLIVMVTRAMICDMPTVRRRVLADELALAADVFDVEPLPLGDPLLGRHNVVHTPHNAGRTRQANALYAQRLADQFLPSDTKNS